MPVAKIYEVDGQPYYFRGAVKPGDPVRDPVQVYYRFKNEEKSSLGMPLPSGTVRVYQADSQGSVQFAGEDRISHTPKDEEVSLHVGNAFDVVAERKQTDYREVSPRVHEMEYEITLRNHKDSSHHCRSERAHRRRLGNAQRQSELDEDRGLCRAVYRSRG